MLPYLVLSLTLFSLKSAICSVAMPKIIANFAYEKFRINSIIFISVIAVIFGCNVFYLVKLYGSIRNDAEREVMRAMTDADIDDLMYRAAGHRPLPRMCRCRKKLPMRQNPRLREEPRPQLTGTKTGN